MYDLDGDGKITRVEMLEIIEVRHMPLQIVLFNDCQSTVCHQNPDVRQVRHPLLDFAPTV